MVTAMSWLSLRIDTDGRHAEALADALLDNGALSVSIEDADAGTAEEKPQFGEPGAVPQLGWERSRVVALVAPGLNLLQLIGASAARAGLPELPTFTQEKVAEQDWVQVTQSQFEPICVSPRLWIVPSWHTPPDAKATVLVVDPGMAFGTGSHPTTRLCLEWLERRVYSGASVLDYGCGSGILAIAAAKLGASRVVGVDLDPQAVTASASNAQRNAVRARFQDARDVLSGNFDIVVANILANPLKILAPALCAYVRPGGCLALSGILVEQTDELIAAYAPYLHLAVNDTREAWVCLTGRKD